MADPAVATNPFASLITKAAPPPNPFASLITKKAKADQAEEGSFIPETAKGIAGGATTATASAIKGLAGQQELAKADRTQMITRAIDAIEKIKAGQDPNEVRGKLSDWDADQFVVSYLDQQSAKDKEDVLTGLKKMAGLHLAKPVQETELYQTGKTVQEWGEDKFRAAKDYENTWSRTITEGLGSTVPIFAATVLSRGTAFAGGSMMSTGEAIDRAIKAGATKEQILQAVNLGGVPGLTESLPFDALLNKVPLPAMGKVMNAIVKVGATVLAEGGQEGLQTAMQNLITKYVYKPDQDILEGVAEAMVVGGVVGGIIATPTAPFTAEDTRKPAAPPPTAPGEVVPEGAEPAATILPPEEVEPTTTPQQPGVAVTPDVVTPAVTQKVGDAVAIPDSPRLTTADRKSPIPNDLIDEGKQATEAATGQPSTFTTTTVVDGQRRVVTGNVADLVAKDRIESAALIERITTGVLPPVSSTPAPPAGPLATTEGVPATVTPSEAIASPAPSVATAEAPTPSTTVDTQGVETPLSTAIEGTPPAPSVTTPSTGRKTYQASWSGDRQGEVDPKYFDVVKDTMEDDSGQTIAQKDKLVAKPNLVDRIPAKAEPGVVYRGISAADYANIQQTGQIASSGDYNMSSQAGLTYYGTDPQTAESYANSFAPAQYKPTFDKPAYVIAVRRPPDSKIRNVPGTGNNEVGVVGPLPASDIVAVYRGDVAAYDPGVKKRGITVAPSARLHWQKVETPSTEPAAQKALKDKVAAKRAAAPQPASPASAEAAPATIGPTEAKAAPAPAVAETEPAAQKALKEKIAAKREEAEAPRAPDETDKAFAKRVVDKRPEPKALPEKYDDYFLMDKATVVPIGDLVSSKTDEENAQGGGNAAKRMAAAAKGELSKRDPITVERRADGKYLIKDGNGTYTSVKGYGWKSMPVIVEGAAAELSPQEAMRAQIRAEGEKRKAAHEKAKEQETAKIAAKREAAPAATPRFQVADAHTTSFTGETATPEQRARFSRHSYTTIDALYEDAQARQDELGAAGKEIADRIEGISFTNPGLKTREKSTKKIGIKGYDDAGQITDAIRGGFHVNEPGQAAQIIRALARHFEVLDEGWIATQQGYFDRKALVRFDDGHIGEVQFWEPHVFQAKEFGLPGVVGGQKGHDIYDEWNTLRKNDPSNLKLDKLNQQMNELYAHALSLADARAWAIVLSEGRLSKPEPKYLNLLRQASSDMRPQVAYTSPKSASTQSVSPGWSSALASKSVKTTGRSSQVQNFTGTPPSDTNVVQSEVERKGETPKFAARLVEQGSVGAAGTGGKGGDRVTIADVARKFHEQHMASEGRQLFPETEAADYTHVLNDMAAPELSSQMEQKRSGVGWYSQDTADAIDITSQLFPTLATDPEHRDLFLIYAGIFGNGPDPITAWLAAGEAFDLFMRTGEIPVSRSEATKKAGLPVKESRFKDKKTGEMRVQPTGWTQRNAVNEQQIALFKGIVERLGSITAAMHWLTHMQPRSEINQAMRDAGYTNVRYPTVEDLKGSDEYGALVFGPKLGRYILGLNGIELTSEDATVDKWFVRTYRRWTGRLFEGPLDESGVAGQPNPKGKDIERRTIFRIVADLAQKFKLRPGDVQAVLWFHEQRLYDASGVPTEAGTNTDGANKLLEQRGVRQDVNARSNAKSDSAGRKDEQRAGRGGADRQRADEGTAQAVQRKGQAEVAPLPGLYELYPSSVGPNAKVTAAKQAYMKSIGMPYRRQAEYVKADPARGKRIADAYDAMAHAPQDRQVKAAYRALIDETIAQYRVLQKALNLKIEFMKPGQENPYNYSPRMALQDVMENGHLWVYPTSEGYGSDAEAAAALTDNPMLEPTDIVIGGHKLVANDVFRIVHDIFGHGPEGAGFGATGEENAWQSHVRMYSPLAARAMTSETRGQNSWVNFGPHGAANQANPQDTVYADQKVGLLPDWVMTEGMAKDEAVRFKVGAAAEAPKGRTETRQVESGVIHYALSPQFAPKAEAFFADLRKALDKFGLTGVKLNVWEMIFADLRGGALSVNGQYARNLIDIAVRFGDPNVTLSHEVIHALFELALTANEKAILLRKSAKEWITDEIKQNYGQFSKEVQAEEGVAHAFTNWEAGERMDGMIARSFKRIKTFLKELLRVLTKYDIRTADDIFRQIQSGKIGQRTQRGEGGRAAAEQPKFVFGGSRAETLDRAGFMRAQDMQDAGASRDEIYDATGFFVGHEGRWRFEINDEDAALDMSGAQQRPNSTARAKLGTLGSILRHPKLFAAYPDLANIPTTVVVQTGTGYSGDYNPDPASETIEVIGRNEEEARSILLHEVMHAVQTREDFAQGGNPTMGEDYEGLEGDVKAVEASIAPLTAEWEAKAAKGDYDSKLARQINDKRETLTRKARHQYYRRIAGEVESRNVQTRDAMRKKMKETGDQSYQPDAPWWTQDTNADKVIFVNSKKDTAFKSTTEPSGPADPRFMLHQPPHSQQQSQQVMQGFIARGQPVDRAIRVPFALLGGIDKQSNRLKLGKRLTDKMGPAGLQGAAIGGILGSGIGSIIAPGVGTYVGAAAGGTVGAYILGSKPYVTTGQFGWVKNFGENAKRGLIDNYGLDPEYVETYRQSDLGKAAILRQAQGIMKVLSNAGVGTAEAQVLKQILTGKPVNDADMIRLAVPIRKAIDDMGAEAVALGLISAESFERNRGAYLHRVYAKNEIDQNTLAGWVSTKMASRRKKIIGDQLKGRGIFWDITPERLMQDFGFYPKPTQGQKVRVLDRMNAAGDKASKRVYWPANKAVPVEFSGKNWVDRGEWEVRRINDKEVTLWRDYTEEERGKMGEIVDARYTIAKTFMLMANDLSTGRFYRDVAANPEWTSDTEPASEWREAADYSQHWNDSNIQWVHVPNTAISKTGGKKRWGALAGKYVRAEIWRDLNELQIASTPNVWRKLLTQWKLNKTARNPVVHMNNIMSNMIFMDLADIRMQDVAAGLKAYIKGDADFQEAVDNGAFGSDMVAQEIRKDVLEPILEEITKAQTGASNPFLARAGALGKFADGVWTWAKWADDRMLRAYQMEDEVFRMAAYMRRRSQGESPKVAALNARDQFLNYDIRAPWIRMMRNSLFPFISYTYRAVPKLMENIMHRPWKLAKYVAIAYAVNALGYLWDDDDEEERERTALRDEEQGNTWLQTPRMIRMPFRDAHGLPVFLDVRRWIPAGDIFDVTQGSSAVPLPSPLHFGGPIQMAFELMLNKKAFDGEEITNALTDTPMEKAAKVGDWAWKSWAPASFWTPYSWYWTKMSNAVYGATDTAGRPYSVPQAALSSFGIKVKPLDVDDAVKWHYLDFRKVQMELKQQFRSNAMRLERGLISQSAHDAAAAKIMEKASNLGQKVQEFSTKIRKSEPVE